MDRENIELVCKLNTTLKLILNSSSKLSLEHIALVKNVIIVWVHDDIRTFMQKFSFPLSINDKSKSWQEIEDKVLKKVSKLHLTESLKEKMSNLVKPIGLQILKWMNDHCIFAGRYLTNAVAEFYWTSEGLIDKKKTAENLTKKTNLHIHKRYELACIYCFEDYIPVLWDKLPESHRKTLPVKLHLNYGQRTILHYWTRVMQKVVHSEYSYEFLFKSSAQYDLKFAAEYFLKKLTPREQQEALVQTAISVLVLEHCEVFLFLLSQLNGVDQMKVFTHRTFSSMQWFLDWPFQGFFTQLANCVWSFIPQTDFRVLLTTIVLKRIEGYRDWDYQTLFVKLWQTSTKALKTSIIDKLTNAELLSSVFKVKDKQILKLILQDADSVKKKSVIYSPKVQKLCQNLIISDEWDFLEYFIKKCLNSEQEMLKFKEEFEKTTRQYYIFSSIAQRKKWDQLFVLSDDSVCKLEKRCIEEGQNSSSKHLRSVQ